MAASTTPTQQFKVVGTRPIRHDGIDKVIGRAKYGADYSLPEMLYAKVLRSPTRTPESNRSTPRRRCKHPGVKAVITYKDLAPQARGGYRYGGECPTIRII